MNPTTTMTFTTDDDNDYNFFELPDLPETSDSKVNAANMHTYD